MYSLWTLFIILFQIPLNVKLDYLLEIFLVAGYKINIQKSAAFLYTNNELLEREAKKTIPFAIVHKRNKFNQGCKSSVLGKLKGTEERH